MPEDSAASQSPIDAQLYGAAKRLFEETLELPAEQRAGYLAQRCGAGSDLYRDVISLLENHDRAGDFFDAPPLADPMIGRRIGNSPM